MARTVAERVADSVEQGWNVVLTHGNGPQVGFVMLRSELADGQVAPVALDYAGADVQGAVGYMFCKALRNVFRRRGLPGEPIALVAQALVEGRGLRIEGGDVMICTNPRPECAGEPHCCHRQGKEG